MPTLSPADRKAMSRQIVILNEQAQGAQDQQDAITKEVATTQENDALNKTFFDEQNAIANAYCDESRSLSGSERLRITEGDLAASAVFDPNSIFFPMHVHPDPEDIWPFLIPKVGDHANAAVSGSHSPAETPSIIGLLNAYDLITTGFNDGAGSTTLASNYIPGAGTMTLTAASTFANGHRIIVDGGGGLFQIVSGGGTTNLTVAEIIPPAGTLAALSTVLESFSGFSDATRQSGTSAAYQTVLDSLEQAIDADVASWEQALNDQQTALQANGDPRATQMAQISAAIADITSALPIINSWQALGATGVGGRFTDAGFAAIMAERTVRASFVTARSAEVDAALGLVVHGGGETYSGTVGEINFERYKWIERRIHRASGSLVGYHSILGTKDITANQKALNDSLLASYEALMYARPFQADGTGTDELNLEDASGFSAGDTIYLLDEDTPEIVRTVLAKEDNTLFLDDVVPATLLLQESARVFKLLP